MGDVDHARRSVAARSPRGRLGRALALLGPGLITGAADDDPAGIVTDTQAGARFQFGLAWTALVQFPLLAAIQIMVARIALVTGRDIARILAEHYSRPVLWGACALLAIANTVTAGADIAGVGAGVQVLTHVPIEVTISVVTILLPVVLIFGHYRVIAGTMKWLTLALFAYVAAAVLSARAWGDVLRHTLLPTITPSRDYVELLVAVFGGTISPYMLVWQSAQEVEEQRAARKKPLAVRPWAVRRELGRMHTDTLIGMGISQVIEYSVFVAAGSAIFPTGLRTITTAHQAAVALHPVGKGLGEILFALGMIGTGLIAIPTLTAASAYAVSAAAHWRAGIDSSAGRARGFNLVLALGIVIAGMIAMTSSNPMQLLVASQVLNGILAPPLLILILLIGNNERIVGQHRNGVALNVLGGVTLLIMSVPSAWLVGSWVLERIV